MTAEERPRSNRSRIVRAKFTKDLKILRSDEAQRARVNDEIATEMHVSK